VMTLISGGDGSALIYPANRVAGLDSSEALRYV